MTTWPAGRHRWTTIGCHARADLAERVKATAEQCGLKIGQWIRQAVEEKLAREEAPSIVPTEKETA